MLKAETTVLPNDLDEVKMAKIIKGVVVNLQKVMSLSETNSFLFLYAALCANYIAIVLSTKHNILPLILENSSWLFCKELVFNLCHAAIIPPAHPYVLGFGAIILLFVTWILTPDWMTELDELLIDGVFHHGMQLSVYWSGQYIFIPLKIMINKEVKIK